MATETPTLGTVFNKEVSAPAKEPTVAAKADTPSEAKAEAPKEAVKPEVKGEPDAKKDQKETGKEEKGVLAPAAETKKEEPPSANWEDDSNPYKKRYAETSKYSNMEHERNVKLERHLEIIQKKLDGTYDPEKDNPTVTVSPDQIKENAELEGRLNASLAVAAEKLGGEEKVNKMIADFSAKYKDNPQVIGRVRLSKAPALEIIKIIKENEFVKKYGDDPDLLRENIRKEYETEMEARIREQVTKEFNDRVSLKEKQPSGLSEVKGAGATKEAPVLENSLANIFRK